MDRPAGRDPFSMVMKVLIAVCVVLLAIEAFNRARHATGGQARPPAEAAPAGTPAPDAAPARPSGPSGSGGVG